MNQVEVKRRQIQSVANIFGLITLIIFGRMIGNNGVAYVGAAYELFSVLFILLGRNVSDVLGKILRGRISRGQYKNAHRMRMYAIIFQGFLGLLGCVLLLCFGGTIITNVFKMPHGAVLAAILAPAFFVQMISGILLGCFQGDGTELYTVIAIALRKVLFFGFGLLFIRLLGDYGQKVSDLLRQEDFVAMYGAIGVATAYAVAELITLIVLIIPSANSRRTRRKLKQEGMRTTDSFGSLIITLYGNMGGLILMQLLTRLPLLLGLIFWQKSVELPAITEFGVFYGNYLAVILIPVFILDAIAIASGAKLYLFRKREESRNARTTFQGCLHFIVAMGLYFATFLMIMGEQMAGILTRDNVATVASLLSGGAFVILFVGASDYFVRILWFEEKWYLAVGGLGIMNVCYAVSLVLFLNNGMNGAKALVFATLIATGLLCVILGVLSCKILVMSPDILRTFVIPAACACGTGLLCLFLGNTFTPHLGNAVTLIVCVVLSFPLYWILLLLFRTIREKELKYIPGSKWLQFFGHLLQLF